MYVKEMLSLVFYSCFFGSDSNWAHVAPKAPSTKYPCIFYTNNMAMVEKLKHTSWTVVFIPSIPIHNCNIKDAMESKYFKACPHRLSELKDYTYWCYSDCKQWVDGEKIEELIHTMESEKKECVFGLHPSNFKDVWGEYVLSMQYTKYNAQKSMVDAFMKNMFEKGYSSNIENHYCTGFSIRKHTEKTIQMNDEWFQAILECGIECQISFSFIQQRYTDTIYAVPFQTGYGFV
jgi:hypothetical protein